MTSKSYFVRVGAPGPSAEDTAAAAGGSYVAAGRDGPQFPYWTWQKPDPLPLDQAQALLEAALRMGCTSLHIQPAEG